MFVFSIPTGLHRLPHCREGLACEYVGFHPDDWLNPKCLKIISNRGQVSAGGKSGSQGLHPGTYNLKPEFSPVSSLENLISLEVEPLSTSHCLICLVKYWATQEAVCNSFSTLSSCPCPHSCCAVSHLQVRSWVL